MIRGYFQAAADAIIRFGLIANPRRSPSGIGRIRVKTGHLSGKLLVYPCRE